jgi:putative heme iron utilization protein
MQFIALEIFVQIAVQSSDIASEESPMSEQFSTEISDRICTHMNEDHASAVVLYAQAFGGKPEATEAQMLAIDANGMDLTAQVNGETVPVRVNFDRTLTDAEDAHHTLIEMVKQARKVAK